MQRICSLKRELAIRIATSLFDGVGATGNLLILGLQTKHDRDIDTYDTTPDGNLVFTGFRQFFSPKIAELIKSLGRINITAVQDRDVRGLKSLAVETGIGFWGKNSLVIHPTYGPWLRFVALRTNFDFGQPEKSVRQIFEGCADCTKCVDACPRKVIQPFSVVDRMQCLANLDVERHTTRRCERCLVACPYSA